MSKLKKIYPLADINGEFERIHSIKSRIRNYTAEGNIGNCSGLVVSWYFPPTTSVRGIASHRLLKYSNHKHFVLFNKNNGTSFDYGPSINPVPTNYNEYPYADFYKSDWYDFALKTYERMSKNGDLDFIFTNSVPIPDHRIGLEVKKRNPFEKWIAFFSDPMANNDHFTFYKRAKLLQESNVENWENQIVREKNNMRDYEINIFEHADLLLFPQDTLAQFMMGDLYDDYKDKIGIVPHSFEQYLDQNMVKNDDRLVLSFVGSLYALQTINDLSESVKMLKMRTPDLNKKLTINVVGNAEESNHTKVINDDVNDIIKFHGEVPHDEAIRWMNSSDYLISLQPRMQNKWLGFIRPAKLADYMSVKKPILLFGDTLGESEKFASKSNNIFCPQSPDLMADLFQALIEGRIRSRDLNIEYYNEHMSMAVSNRYDRLIGKMLSS